MHLVATYCALVPPRLWYFNRIPFSPLPNWPTSLPPAPFFFFVYSVLRASSRFFLVNNLKWNRFTVQMPANVFNKPSNNTPNEWIAKYEDLYTKRVRKLIFTFCFHLRLVIVKNLNLNLNRFLFSRPQNRSWFQNLIYYSPFFHFSIYILRFSFSVFFNLNSYFERVFFVSYFSPLLSLICESTSPLLSFAIVNE